MAENTEKAATEQLKTIPVSDFQRCYEEWEQRLRKELFWSGQTRFVV